MIGIVHVEAKSRQSSFLEARIQTKVDSSSFPTVMYVHSKKIRERCITKRRKSALRIFELIRGKWRVR